MGNLAGHFLDRGLLQGLDGSDELVGGRLLGEAVEHDAAEVVNFGDGLGSLGLGLVTAEELFPSSIDAGFGSNEVNFRLYHAALVADLDGMGATLRFPEREHGFLVETAFFLGLLGGFEDCHAEFAFGGQVKHID